MKPSVKCTVIALFAVVAALYFGFMLMTALAA